MKTNSGTIEIGITQTDLNTDATKGISSREYVHAKNMLVDEFKQYISKTELKRGNPKTATQVNRIFSFLDRIGIILHDKKTAKWRGRKTPPNGPSIGIKRKGKRGYAQCVDSHRERFGHIEAKSKAEVLLEIQAIEDCDEKTSGTDFYDLPQ